MCLKKILSVLMVTVCLCTCLCFTAYAEENNLYMSDEIVPAYEIAQNPNSVLNIRGTSATCESSAKGMGTANSRITKTDYSLSKIKTQLNAGKPVVVEGWNGSIRHMALVVACKLWR